MIGKLSEIKFVRISKIIIAIFLSANNFKKYCNKKILGRRLFFKRVEIG